MAGSGLKYVHATDKGRNGMMGDLERSREKVLLPSFILLINDVTNLSFLNVNVASKYGVC